MDLSELVATYVTSDPGVSGDSRVTAFIDGSDYNDALAAALARVGTDADSVVNRAKGDFIYIHGWWLGLLGGKVAGGSGIPVLDAGVEVPPYRLGAEPLLNILKEKAAKGVDVRVMGWCHFAVINSPFARGKIPSITRSNVMTLESIRALRNDPNIGGKAILNIIHHTGGAAHAKLVVIGNTALATGFTGGIDLVADRYATSLHPGGEFWHDVMARVEGPGVQGLYDWFRVTWAEVTTLDGRPRPQLSFRTAAGELRHDLLTSPAVEARDFSGSPSPVGGAGTPVRHRVQSLRTIPAKRYQALSFAPAALRNGEPEAGEFKLRDAWEKAIKAATRYVYIEDQALQSTEILGWVNARVKQVSDLRVVLVTGATGDPNDPATNTHSYLCQSFNNALLTGLDAAQRARVRVFRRWGDGITIPGSSSIISIAPGPGGTFTVRTDLPGPAKADALKGKQVYLRQGSVYAEITGNKAAAPGQQLEVMVKAPTPTGALVAGPVSLYIVQGLFVHTKTTIVDDHWAIIGSANCMRRSLYTDHEHAVAFVDADDTGVKEYRKSLWAHHFRNADPNAFDDIDAALHAWEPSWFTAGAAPARPSRVGAAGPEWIEPLPLPLTDCAPLTSEEQSNYDVVLDVDSRHPWGFVFPPSL